jgi:hypothetical protein
MSARGAKKGEAQSCVPEQSSPPSLPAPDVKKFQQRVADLSVQIRDEENKRVSHTLSSFLYKYINIRYVQWNLF